MGGHYDADVNWFRFAHEPSYTLRLGPKFDFFDEFKSLREQFSEQAVAKGDFSVCLHGGWKDERAYERVLNFFLSTRTIFKNDEDWGPDFGLRKERQGFLFPDTPIQNPVYIRERIDGYYRASLFHPQH